MLTRGCLLFLGTLLVACTDATLVSEDSPTSQARENTPVSETPVLNPQAALASFSLAPGFQIEAVASEPLVEDPVAAAWDEDGRLYVAEMRAFMRDVEGTGEEEPIGSVVRLTDLDSDGVFDHREVLLDGLVLPRAVRILNEGLLVGEMGKLWLCPTPSGWSKDIDCSAKVFLGPYGVHQGSVEHAENGLLVGLDNWIYSAKSERRLKLVDSELVEEPTLFRGQWGITQDAKGRFLYNTNSNLLLGDFYDAQAIVVAGGAGAAGLNARVSSDDEVFAVRTNRGVNRAYIPGVLRDDGRLRNATSASGMVVYQGGQFDETDPETFVAEPAANLVAAFSLVEAGVALAARRHLYPHEAWGERDFLASTDERFRPVDVLNGPDGALYIIDFYRGVIQDHVFLSDELKKLAIERGLDRPLGMGRIWRISKAEDEARQPLPKWAALDGEALVALLSAPDIWRRETAQRLLLRETETATIKRLEETIEAGSVNAAVRSLWILKERGALTPQVLELALKREPSVAEAGLLAGGQMLPTGTLMSTLQSLEKNSRAYLYTISALGGSVSNPEVLTAMLDALLNTEGDRHIQAFTEAAVRGFEAEFIASLVESGRWSSNREQEAKVIANLANQMVRAEGSGAALLLDYVESDTVDQLWVKQAVLTGLFEASRAAGFERVMLSASHDIFEITDSELWPFIAKARRTFTWPGDTLAEDAKPLTPQQAELVIAGEQFFNQSCANCHGLNGEGVGALGPPLANSEWVTKAPERLARIVLHGLQGPIEVLGQEWNSAMPGHKHFPGFDDRVASGLMTYLRRSWGHSGRAINPGFVAEIRAETDDRTSLWTASELMAIQINTHFEKYAGSFGRPDAPMRFSYNGTDLVVHAGIFEGPLLEQKEDHFIFQPRNIEFEFVVEADSDGPASAVMLDFGNGKVAMPRLP